MKTIVFCWSGISGYMAACWRELVSRQRLKLHVLAFAPQGGGCQVAFEEHVMAGVPCRLLDPAARKDVEGMQREIVALKPDYVVFPGWMHQPYRELAARLRRDGISLVLTIDTPWWGTPRQHLGRFLLRRYIRLFDSVFVPGERAWQYAWRLGFPASRISRGLYGVDVAGLVPVLKQRESRPWPRRFLFVGRYAPVKGMDVLVAGYRRYRELVGEPWELACCGRGPESVRIAREPGVIDLGFLQPEELKAQWSGAGSFVLPSRFDPWPLVLVEAAAAGLPLVASDACGSAVEVLRPHYNGWTFPAGDADALAHVLLRCHEQYSKLPGMGQRSQALAAPYAAEYWAERWEQRLLASPSR